jgi:hypothetical protein
MALKFNPMTGEFDQVFVGVSDWVSFAPSGTFTNTTYAGFWRREGDSMRVRITGSLTGTPGAADLFFTVPESKTIDTTKISSTAGLQIVGIAKALDSGTGTFTGMVRYQTTTTVSVQGNNIAATWSNTVPFGWAVNDNLSVEFLVPIVGW